MSKVAIIHEWLSTYAGSERVVEQLLQIFPEADVHAVCDFLPPEERGFLGGRPVRTTFIQKLPFARRAFRHYLPLMPLAIEQLELAEYDLVISSSHAVAKGVITGPHQTHISYVHSPMRYAWDMQGQYLRESKLGRGPLGWALRVFLHYLRLWDTRTANGVDQFVANSRFIARRVRKAYGRESRVIYPPVDIQSFAGIQPKQDFFLTASRMVPYKKMPLIVEAFAKMPDLRLVVIGDGPDRERCRAAATPNVALLGYQPFESLRSHMQRARAFVFAAEEDFGITPVEAQAAGAPVIAYGRGGACETVRPLGGPGRPTGLFFEEQSVEAICAAVRRFLSHEAEFSARACTVHAATFSAERFRTEFLALVREVTGAEAAPRSQAPAATGTGG